jgi:hypothetical protein
VTQIPPDAPMSVRIGARLGPEGLASILVVPVVLVAVLVFLVARGSGQPSAVVPPGPSGSSTPAASTPAATTPVAATPVAATPVTTAGPTPVPTTARIVLQLVDELLANRSDLATSAAPRRPDAQDIADRLRAVNATLVTLGQPLAELRRDGNTTDIANRILAVSNETSDAVVATQRASIINVPAYRAGGLHVVDVMEPLVAIRVDLIGIVGPIASP